MSTAGWVRGGVLLLLLCLCIFMSLLWKGSIEDNGEVTLYLPESSISYRDMLASEKRTAVPVPFALWRQQEGIAVENTELERSDRVSIMTVFGDSTIPLPSLPMLLPDSGLACIVDRNTCYALFGDESPVGGRIEIDDMQYTIIGVFDWPSGMVVRQGRGDQDTACDRITLALPNVAGVTQSAEEFAMRHGLAPFAVARPGFRIDTIGFLPSRWSDFEFWSLAAERMKEQLWSMLVLPKELPQALPMRSMLYRAIWIIATIVLAVPLFFFCKRAVVNIGSTEEPLIFRRKGKYLPRQPPKTQTTKDAKVPVGTMRHS